MDIFYVLLLFLALSAIVTSKKAPLNCQKDPQKRNCFEILNNGQGALKYEDKELHITCYNLTLDIGSIDMNMENVSILRIKNCKPTNETFFNRLSTVSKLSRVDVTNGSWDDSDANLLFGLIKNSNVSWISLTINHVKNFPKLESAYLQHLDLSNNSIEDLSEGIKCISLKRLILKNNLIRYVSESVFVDSPNLLHIDLSNNNIVQLPPKLLHPLRSLDVIELNLNGYHEIPMGFFKNNVVVSQVILTHARLTEIPENMFPNRKDLISLKFGNNSISSLPENVFLNMNNLVNLDLSVNKFSNITNNTFKGLFKLRYLHLFHNKLTTWSHNYHRDLRSLNQLILSNNFLKAIEADAFAGLQNLMELDLGYNFISVIDKTAFLDLTRLTHLILYDNKLTTLDAIINVPIGNKWGNLRIYLSRNNISYIDVPDPSSQSATKKLYLRANPIICDCKFFTTLKYLRNGSAKLLSGAEKCAYPAKWNGTYLKNIGLNNFTCEDDSLYPCPESCNCQIHPFDGIFEINCSNAGLTRLPTIPSLNMMPLKFGIVLKTIWVNLTKNSLSEFIEDHSYKSVSVLDLSYNKLREMKWIPPDIEMLHLHNNELSKIDEDTVGMLNQSETLKKVTFDKNPWDCDCDLVHFAKTLRSHMRSVIPNHTLTCYDGYHLLELDESTCNFKIYMVLIVIVSIILLTFTIFIVLYVYFQDYVKLWVYKHKLFLWMAGERDTDEDKKYDAFVSYSHKDEDFIVKHLLPELESKENYSLCLHERDWIVGELISKQIIDSVYNSRRTIIVLSKNFLDSDWANMEFKTAYSKSLADKKNRLIIILYDDIDLSSISNQELKMYLNTQTYIKWGDRWFWKKLKQSMPTTNINKTRRPKLNTEIKDTEASVVDVS